MNKLIDELFGLCTDLHEEELQVKGWAKEEAIPEVSKNLWTGQAEGLRSARQYLEALLAKAFKEEAESLEEKAWKIKKEAEKRV